MADMAEEKLYKLLVVGGIGTGKTCWIRKYAFNQFSRHYKSTIGVDFAFKELKWDDGLTLKLQLWDIAGQERFTNLTRSYYKEAVGGFVFFDVTRTTHTLSEVRKWKEDIDGKVEFMGTERPIPVLLVANKIDLLNLEDEDENGVKEWDKMKDILDKMVEDHGFIGWIDTSALDNINLENAVKKLVAEVLKREKEANKKDEAISRSVIGDDDALRYTNNKSGGCCT